MNISHSKLENLHESYIKERNIILNRKQFVHLVKIFPSLLILISDGIVDHEERLVMSVQASKLGYALASDDLGLEKEENLMLIYRAEFRYLIKNRHKWEQKFLNALKDYIKGDDKEKMLIRETMQLFASASNGTSKEEDHAMSSLTQFLGL